MKLTAMLAILVGIFTLACSGASSSGDALGVYFEQTITTNEEFVGVMQSLADWQDAAYPKMQRMVSSSRVTRFDLGALVVGQQAALEEAYTGLRDVPVKWAAVAPPDDLVEYHDLMLQVIKLKLEAIQKWQAGVNFTLLDSNQSMRLMTEGDRLDDQADGIYLQAVAEGTKKGLPFGS